MDRHQQPSMLILGAGSDLGWALAAAVIEAGLPLIAAARQPLAICPATDQGIAVRKFDVNDVNSHTAFLDGLPFLPDIVVCMVGLLGDQRAAESDFEAADLIMSTNFTGPVSILAKVAARMEQRGHGAIIGISSVAGDRGRAENYYYGAAKAGFSAFLSGLRQRFGRTPIRIVTIKPGRLRTKMTEGIGQGRIESILSATPQQVVPALLSACLKARGTVYLPWYWRPIMILLRAVPEMVFRRMAGPPCPTR